MQPDLELWSVGNVSKVQVKQIIDKSFAQAIRQFSETNLSLVEINKQQ
jgi:hypothetical protein